MDRLWLKNIAKQATDAIENARVSIEENVVKSQPHVENMLKQLGDNVAVAAQNIQRNLAGDPFSRGPLTEAEIDSLDLVYLTPRIISSAFPINRLFGAARPPVQNGNSIDLMAALLHQNHEGRFMVWNISEETYDYSFFKDQVIEFRFPGSPIPPLGMIFKICTSIESWLMADPSNVAVVHCLTGMGRTTAVLACLLAWLGDAALSPMEALGCVASAKGKDIDNIVIPSQKRYVQYFSNVLDGVRPRSEPLVLKRVIMNTIPRFGEQKGALGCCPYFQAFKDGKMVFCVVYNPPTSPLKTSPPQLGDTIGSELFDSASDLSTTRNLKKPNRWAYSSDESIILAVDSVLQGDYMIRGRHYDPGAKSATMFRASFHTGYVPCGVLRLGLKDLDGTKDDDRFDEDFFIDLIFAPLERSIPDNEEQENEFHVDSNVRNSEVFDAMLLRDTKFWEDIEIRKALREERLTLQEGHEKVHAIEKISESPSIAIATQNQFSISLDDDESSTQNSKRSTKNIASTKSSIVLRESEGISNEDLLAQLSEVEEDEEISLTENSSKFEKKQMSNKSKEVMKDAERELTALEELEKELGLMMIDDTDDTLKSRSEFKSEQTSKGNTKIDDDIDDFESYLESVA